jgi:N-acetylneuraminic acid mutarotase
VWNAATETWTTFTPLGFGQYAGCAATLNGVLYVVGGYNQGYNAVVETLDSTLPGTAWGRAPDYPIPLANCQAFAFQNQLFVLGGATGNGVTNAVYKLSADGSSWLQAPSMLTARANFGIAAHYKGHLYALGGTSVSPPTTGSMLAAAESFDGISWTRIADMPADNMDFVSGS